MPQDLKTLFDTSTKYDGTPMPVVFVGHGSPMHAIQDNSFTQSLAQLAKEIPKPKAILTISAHWLSAGTWVTRMSEPRTIHDFGGFPQELFDVQYPAPGDPELAKHIQTLSERPKIQGDENWGLDHGTWAVLRKMYPEADIPVLQLSIDMSEPPSFHFELGKKLRSLREQGVLILGSGNIVHNLRRADWDKTSQGFDWAVEFDEWTKERLLQRDFKSLTEDFMKTTAGQLSVPTPDHYLPLLYVLGAANEKEELDFQFEGYDLGSISMRGLSFGKRG
ncbi:4,5-DOPA dioxygenase extradiol [Bdellovibrio bacteriovorus]|uniref:4,5-DOPA-extradiol-dioxygenase n=1 Tax=Bdellovibrio bacteriovorus TaxID=959 RepID=UPI0035A96C0C